MPVVTVMKEKKMSAAHQLPYHDGKCKNLHGHTFVVQVYVQGHPQEVKVDNPESGMVVDFKVIGEFLNKVDEELMDHKLLNDSIDIYPTCERLCLYLLDYAKEHLTPNLPEQVRLTKIRVYEEHTFPCCFAEIDLTRGN